MWRQTLWRPRENGACRAPEGSAYSRCMEGKKGSGGPSEPAQADGLIAVLSFRGQKTLLPSCLDALEEPGEVSPQVPHGLQALLV